MKSAQVKQVYRGLVMGIEKDTMIVMTAQGEFLKTRFQDQAVIGDEVSFVLAPNAEDLHVKHKGWKPIPLGLVRVAAGFMGIVVATGMSWAIPVGQVYMDVNPSLGLSYNIYERVIGVEGFNADGETIKEGLSVYGKSIEESVEATLTLMDEKGYVKDQQADVILGYTTENEKVKTAAVKAVTAVVEKVEKSIAVAEVAINGDDQSKAKTAKTSPIQAALAKKEAKPVVDEKLKAIQKKLLNQQKQIEQLKQKSENLEKPKVKEVEVKQEKDKDKDKDIEKKKDKNLKQKNENEKPDKNEKPKPKKEKRPKP